MTIFGPDLSSYQDGVDVAALPHPFVIAKCTEGTYYTDRDYTAWLQRAAGHGKIFIPYHFVSGEDPDAQAKHFAAAIGNNDLQGMLDFEPTATYRPPLSQLLAVADACHRQRIRIALAYLPRWYWEQLGSPDLRALDARGIHLVSSAYPGGAGYPGDGAAGWKSYGGMTPALYQFTNAAQVQGRGVDMNAFRGTAGYMAALLTGTTPSTGGTMAVLDSTDARTVWAYSNGDRPDVHQTLANAAAAAAAASVKLDRVLQILGVPAPTVDPAALAAALVPPLAAALAPHIADVDAEQIAQAAAEPVAHAVLTHMAAALKAG